jgi:putative transposase
LLTLAKLWRWVQKSEAEPKLLSPWPVSRLSNWIDRVSEPLTDKELEAVRRCVKRGSPSGDADWVASTSQRLGLKSTLRSRGRPRVRPGDANNES